MKILALVLARGGSKRLPGKNIRMLGGKPLINWSIDAALGVPGICEVLVSTDDPAIAQVCRAAGALVPWLRPAELASDTASSVDVALHALDWYEAQHGAVDALLLLQPTSPFRSRLSIERGIALFAAHCADPGTAAGTVQVVGVSPCAAHPLWAMKLEGGRLVPFVPGAGLQTRSQDLPDAYMLNGAFYLTAPGQLRASRTFAGPGAVPLVIESAQEALDIDTPFDWIVAQAVLAQPDGHGVA